jgi:hypothetical protein
MFHHRPPLGPLAILALAITASASSLAIRDGHGHHHNPHAAPLLQFNETLHIPPSYWSIDMEDHASSEPRYPGLMAGHVIFMCLAFFVVLPMGKCILGLYSSTKVPASTSQVLQCDLLSIHGTVLLY